MRAAVGAAALSILAAAEAAEAATIVVFTDPMTLSRRTVVYDTPGRNRLLVCMSPPGESGCTELPMKRRRQA